jgi:hypothetical protein
MPGEGATCRTCSPCGAPVAVSQSRTVSSPEPDATSLPSGEKATDQTQPEWPMSGSPYGAPVAALRVVVGVRFAAWAIKIFVAI